MTVSSQHRAFRKARRQNEYQLACAVAEYLDYALPDTARFTHIPHGEKRDAKTGAKLKRMGVRKGWPDFIILACTRSGPATLCIELKDGSGLSPSQRDFRQWCEDCHHSYRVCTSIDDVRQWLVLNEIQVKAR